MLKLKRAGAIKEVFYPEWLANMVVVKSKVESEHIDDLGKYFRDTEEIQIAP